jgi:hypothetical protein
MRSIYALAISALVALPVAAAAATGREPGRLALPAFSALAKKATRSVDISLDPSELGMAAGLLSNGHDANSAALSQLIAGLRGVYVRSYHFPHADEYSRAAVKTVMAQLAAPDWTPIVAVHQHKRGRGDTDINIYILRRGARTEGMAIIAEKPRELTIVNIVGSIDLAKLEQLQGQFGVPKVRGTEDAKAPAAR